jgi:hypothetical protein
MSYRAGVAKRVPEHIPALTGKAGRTWARCWLLSSFHSLPSPLFWSAFLPPMQRSQASCTPSRTAHANAPSAPPCWSPARARQAETKGGRRTSGVGFRPHYSPLQRRSFVTSCLRLHSRRSGATSLQSQVRGLKPEGRRLTSDVRLRRRWLSGGRALLLLLLLLLELPQQLFGSLYL